MGKKLSVVDGSGALHNTPDFIFECPGCGHSHGLYITHPNDIGHKWGFDGNMESPTVTPSINSKWTYAGGKKHVCHFFIRQGKIQFLGDCTHELKGQTVDMEDVDT